MCGIAGKLYNDPERRVEAEALVAMAERLAHRGPDDDGLYLDGNAGLAMRRLAVIDLVGGRQPIHNEDRSVWTVCNGEIYNYRELRRDLEVRGHRFYTQSDTEVLVHLYEEYGADLPRHLNGMFALAVWDGRRRRLLLARDRLGIKPLYYAALPDRLLFASEIKAIRADGPSLSLDLQALNEYLSLLYIPAPASIYREVRKLEPGHTLLWQGGAVMSEPYWRLEAVEPLAPLPPLPALQEEFRALLADAVRRQLVADVPLGIYLSGGLDSGAVVALARRAHNGPLRTFSIGFDDPSYDETAQARLTAQRFETEHVETIVRPDAAGVAHNLAAQFDEPFADSSAIPAYYLAEMTRRHVTVALAGDGGDELFAGYLTYQADKLAHLYQRLPGVLSRGLVPAVVRRLPVSEGKVSFDFKARRFVGNALLEPGRRHFAWKAFFDAALKRRLLRPELLAAVEDELDGYRAYRRCHEAAGHLDEISRFQYADTRVYLPDDNLLKVDQMSMAHSLEVRVPLLDHRLVELAFRLPGPVKMPGLRLKHFMRQALQGVLPPETLRRPKRGFNVPMARWLKSDLRPLVDEYLSPGAVRRQGYLQPECVRGLVEAHLAGRADHTHHLWGLLMFALWVESGWRVYSR